MEETIIKKKKTFYLCGECRKDLSHHGSSYIFSGFFAPPVLYCENKECKHFGLLKVVGIKEEREV